MEQSDAAAPQSRHRSSGWTIALVLLGAAAVAVPFLTPTGRAETELMSRAHKSHLQHKMIHKAESETASFANHDVTRAVLKAQQEAKAAYAKMMGSALQVEAAAHRQGELSTENELAYQARREQQRIAVQRARSERDEQVQNAYDAKAQEAMSHALDREMGSRILTGQ